MRAPHLFEKCPLGLLSLREAAVGGVAQVVNARSGAPYDKHLRLRRSLLTHVPTICQMNRAVVHAVASLFDHNRLLSIVFSPSLACSLTDERPPPPHPVQRPAIRAMPGIASLSNPNSLPTNSLLMVLSPV